MSKIYTIEPLDKLQQEYLAAETGLEVVQLERSSFLSHKEDCLQIEILICRDRDNVLKIIEICSYLKLIFIVSTGVEKLPFSKIKEKGIVVCNTGGINAPIMSEYVMGAILQHSTRFRENILNQTQQYWKKFQCVDSLNEKKLLVVGAGRTGQLIARKAKAFGMYVVGVKKHFENVPFFDNIVSLDSLDEELNEADFVVCTIPLTSETFHLFDYTKFEKMKESAVFINISRGKICVEKDLVEALTKQKLACAVLDVFDKEPLEKDNALWNCPNVVITPHSSGRLDNFMSEAIKYAANNINAFLKGEELPNKVNIEYGY